MAPGISYDDSGSLASYFGVTCLAIVLIPTTYLSLRPAPKDPLKPLCDCSECKVNQSRLHGIRSAATKRRYTRRILPLIAAWVFFAYLAYGLYTAPSAPGETVYNPFEILGISSASTEKQIKKHYKKLSLQFHPDKIKLGENETMEDAESKFVDLTKAYKSLTDEVTRENLAKYGNPDGPQQREDKIAIPKWVVEGKNNIWILGAYGLVLGLGIPFVVGRWWFRQRRLTRDGILNPTAELFFHQLREDTDFLSLISLLASAVELQAVLAGKRKMSKKERKERQARIEELEKTLETLRADLGIEESPTMRADSRVTVTTAAARRARALLWAHLLRFDLEPELASEQLEVLRALPPLLNGLNNIALAHNWLSTSLLCFKLQPALVQALPAGASPLAQLPGISQQAARELEVVKAAEGKRWLEKWVKADLTAVDGVEEALKVAKTWPRLEIVSAEFKVTGEKIVTPGALVSLTYRCRYIYPTTPRPAKLARVDSVTVVEDAVVNGAVDEKTDVRDEKTDIKDEKDANDFQNEKSENVKVDTATKMTTATKTVSAPNPAPAPLGYVHAPRWPANRRPQVQLLIGDSKLDKVIVQPVRILDIPMPLPDGTPAEPVEFTLPFQAPPQANLYSFVAHWSSDTFLGADVIVPIMLRVEDVASDAESDDEDISDPEEDSLAGQLAMMRGGKVRPSDVHGGGDGDESEYETDSSSDEDGPRRKRAINEDTDSDSD